ncbi:MAG: 50S ribosomal protein L29 [FCB group bacterium]|nr:50S ribosomal protein L29 [FCB group bacterium]
MLKVQTLREMTRDELLQKKQDLLDEQFNLNMRRSLKALDNPLRLRQIRRELAKIMTILHEDELGLRKLAESSTSILSNADNKSKSEDNKA